MFSEKQGRVASWVFSIVWLDNRAIFQIKAAVAVFSGKQGRFTPWVFCGFSPCFLHRVCWITWRFFQQHCSGSNVFWKTRAFIHHFVVGFSGSGGGTLESHYISFLEVRCSVFNL